MNPDAIRKLLASASAASSAATDMIDVARDGQIRPIDNVGSGETLEALADATRLLIDAMSTDDTCANQLHGALIKFLDELQ